MNHSKKASSQFFKAHGNSAIIFDFHKKVLYQMTLFINDDISKVRLDDFPLFICYFAASHGIKASLFFNTALFAALS